MSELTTAAMDEVLRKMAKAATAGMVEAMSLTYPADGFAVRVWADDDGEIRWRIVNTIKDATDPT